MTDGSGWFSPLYEGLVTPKHIDRLGKAVWLYLYILKFATLHGGEMMYSHVDAAHDLDVPRGTIRRWFTTLQEHGYITNQGQSQHGIKVRVTKWRPVEKFNASVGRSNRSDSEESAAENAETSIERVLKNEHPEQPEQVRVLTRVLTRVLKNEHPLYIRISKVLKNLSIPFSSENGADGPDFLEGIESFEHFFRVIHEGITSADNKTAALMEFFVLCYPDRGAPAYGKLGAMANRVGGHGRMADLIWQSLCRPPTGDVLSYLVKVHEAKKRRNEQGQGFDDPESSHQRIRRAADAA